MPGKMVRCVLWIGHVWTERPELITIVGDKIWSKNSTKEWNESDWHAFHWQRNYNIHHTLFHAIIMIIYDLIALMIIIMRMNKFRSVTMFWLWNSLFENENLRKTRTCVVKWFCDHYFSAKSEHTLLLCWLLLLFPSISTASGLACSHFALITKSPCRYFRIVGA